ncbi:GNAT family N-acetyltransferase [Alkaliphilus hydrothermalis]|uniref:Acetyltransferase n=1 Tax=Alkaliphilus hydrothermalis TaxID=1482730 RepID=A0ABS2NTF3_9FIRM|nr:GNAT family N-acetyltransferase [Alkaliphilus hydrothermalis]MBM7616233.1 putative acetyltransferase [Alkaliphilus hydrothermalis]
MKLELVRASKEIEEAYYEFIKEWEKNGQSIVPMSVQLRNMDFDTWLQKTYEIEKRETCPENLVPAHTFFLMEDGKRVLGAINIRHELNEFLLNYGGHIGYGVRPSERQKGYAAKMLAMALPIAKEFGIDRALITCDKENVGSAKTIMKNGGILENEVLQEDGEMLQRYWIEL